MDLPHAIDIQKTAIARIAAGLFALLGLTAGAALGRTSREIHRNILHVLRPAESALRRLIVVLARAIVVKAPVARPAPAGIVRAGQGKLHISFQLFDPRQRIFTPPRRPDTGPGPRIAFAILCVSAPSKKSFDQSGILRQLSDLGVQRFQIHRRRLRRTRAPRPENARRPFQQQCLPATVPSRP